MEPPFVFVTICYSFGIVLFPYHVTRLFNLTTVQCVQHISTSEMLLEYSTTEKRINPKRQSQREQGRVG
jgi:hypothetical protein